jgi:hypothetical protein
LFSAFRAAIIKNSILGDAEAEVGNQERSALPAIGVFPFSPDIAKINIS